MPGRGLSVRISSTNTSTDETSTLSLHDALPIFEGVEPREGEYGPYWYIRSKTFDVGSSRKNLYREPLPRGFFDVEFREARRRSEEHTSELQSLRHLVCRLLLEKKKISSSYSDAP